MEVIVCVVFDLGPAYHEEHYQHRDGTFTRGGKSQGGATDLTPGDVSGV